MAIDMFLKLSGISGDSTDPTYPGWISVLAWSWGESNSGVAGGHPNFEDLCSRSTWTRRRSRSWVTAQPGR